MQRGSLDGESSYAFSLHATDPGVKVDGDLGVSTGILPMCHHATIVAESTLIV